MIPQNLVQDSNLTKPCRLEAHPTVLFDKCKCDTKVNVVRLVCCVFCHRPVLQKEVGQLYLVCHNRHCRKNKRTGLLMFVSMYFNLFGCLFDQTRSAHNKSKKALLQEKFNIRSDVQETNLHVSISSGISFATGVTRPGGGRCWGHFLVRITGWLDFRTVG